MWAGSAGYDDTVTQPAHIAFSLEQLDVLTDDELEALLNETVNAEPTDESS